MLSVFGIYCVFRSHVIHSTNGASTTVVGCALFLWSAGNEGSLLSLWGWHKGANPVNRLSGTIGDGMM